MRKAVPEYIVARNNLFRYFDCPDSYLVRTMTNTEWTVRTEEGISFLTLFIEDTRAEFVVVRKDNAPLVYQSGEYTMVIAIDCIKIAFVLKNESEQ